MNLKNNYLTKNDCYKSGRIIPVKGLMIHSVGCSQPKASVFMNNWNKPGLQVCVHGFIEPNGDVNLTLPCMETSGKAMRGWHGGGASNNTHLGFEMTEPASITYKGGATWVDNNPAVTKAHVLATYKTAVELFAELCKFHKLNPLADGVIISHHEGNQRGIASNHGDTEHIWNKFGLTMNQFRKDIYNKMNNQIEEDEDMTQEKFNEMMNAYLVQLAKEEPGNWSADARKWAESNGVINGDSEGRKMYRKFLTREEAAQILFNLHGKK